MPCGSAFDVALRDLRSNVVHPAKQNTIFLRLYHSGMIILRIEQRNTALIMCNFQVGKYIIGKFKY